MVEREKGKEGEGRRKKWRCLPNHCKKVSVGKSGKGIRTEVVTREVHVSNRKNSWAGTLCKAEVGKLLVTYRPWGSEVPVQKCFLCPTKPQSFYPKSQCMPAVQGCYHSTQETVRQLHAGEQSGIHKKILNIHNICV